MHNTENALPCPDNITCSNIGIQYADVSLPIKLNPFAALGELKTECCGEPTITLRHTPSPCSCGCELVITQTVCIKIPLQYGATAEPGELSVSCKRPSPPCIRPY